MSTTVQCVELHNPGSGWIHASLAHTTCMQIYGVDLPVIAILILIAIASHSTIVDKIHAEIHVQWQC